MAIKKAVTKKEDSKKVSLKEQAKKNTTITKKVPKEPEQVIEKGTPLDHAIKQSVDKGQPDKAKRTVGMSFGCTKNMDNYESLRIDCWLTDEVQEGETQQDALIRISDVIQSHLEYELERITGE